MVFCVSHCVLMCLTVCLVFCFYCVTLCFPALLMFGAVLKWCTRSLFPVPVSLLGNIKIKGTSWGIGSRFGTHPLCEGVHWSTMSFCFVLVHPRGLTKSMIINWFCWFDSPRLKPRFCGPQRLEILFSFVCVFVFVSVIPRVLHLCILFLSACYMGFAMSTLGFFVYLHFFLNWYVGDFMKICSMDITPKQRQIKIMCLASLALALTVAQSETTIICDSL